MMLLSEHTKTSVFIHGQMDEGDAVHVHSRI